jgi:putative hydrolase of the HAD superfamily
MSRWVHPGIRAVFFDAVGTLLFPEPPAPVVYGEAARRQGLAIPPEVIRRRFVAAFRAEEDADRAAGWVTSEEREVARWRRIVAESLLGVADPEACFRELFDHFAKPAAWSVNSDAAAVFAALGQGGLLLGLASNYDARLWSVLEGNPELAPLLDRVVISAMVGHRKPSQIFFDGVARVAECELAEVLIVGDDFENDYEGATAAGMNAVLLDQDGRHHDIPQRIKTLAELLAPA